MIGEPEPKAYTLAAYRKARRAWTREEYHLTAGQYRTHYPEHAITEEWMLGITNARHAGHVFTRQVLDSYANAVGTHLFWRMFRGVDAKCVPDGYITPEVRKLQAAQPRIYRGSRARHKLASVQRQIAAEEQAIAADRAQSATIVPG